MFNTSINQEYLTLFQELDFSIDDIRKLSLNGIEASFMPDNDKLKMKSLFDNEWTQLLSEYRRILPD